jgi:hypothetical protein
LNRYIKKRHKSFLKNVSQNNFLILQLPPSWCINSLIPPEHFNCFNFLTQQLKAKKIEISNEI